MAFDDNVRNGSKEARRQTGAFPPARFVHADYTLKSAPQRVRDLLPAHEADYALTRRYGFVNVWRPISGPVQNEALALLDAQSVAPRDLVATDLLYSDRTGEIYNVYHAHQPHWHTRFAGNRARPLLEGRHLSLQHWTLRSSAHALRRA